jgi:nitrate/TMAO reductase-like tetraheme cytochrome c subunit
MAIRAAFLHVGSTQCPVRTTFLPMAAGLVLAASLGLAAVAGAADKAAERNQCVDCHEVEHLPISLGHSITEWRASAHGHAGVGCEKCHGGDPRAHDAEKAHVGVLSATDPKSLVNIHNLAAMCGSCHKEELKAYKSTVHAEEVTKDGEAATCVTCHGAMATSLPSPTELKSRCTVCHDRPVEARAALTWLAAAKTELRRVQRSLETAKTAVPEWHKDALVRFHGMEKDYAEIALKWHTFHMDSSLKKSRDLLELAKLLNEEARLKIKASKEKKD